MLGLWIRDVLDEREVRWGEPYILLEFSRGGRIGQTHVICILYIVRSASTLIQLNIDMYIVLRIE